METEKKHQPEKENIQEKTDKWIDKAEEFIDEAAEKIHRSETYKKVDQTAEKATKKLFRQAGKLWGKSEQYFRKKSGDGSQKSENRKPDDR